MILTECNCLILDLTLASEGKGNPGIEPETGSYNRS